jgi:hypothetical protein
MKIQLRKVDEEKGIMQLTTLDERWYFEEVLNKKEKKTEITFYPSSSWICGFYPKGVAFYKWLAEKGWDEAETIKKSAGDKGSKVHKAIEDLIKGKEVSINDKYYNETLDCEEELTPEEWICLMSFAKWVNDVKPKFILTEQSAINKKIGYGGTIDCVCDINGQIYLIDFKTSQYIWKEYELQISSYKELLPYIDKTKDIDLSVVKLAILQVGYNRNKNEYKFTEIDDKFDLFLNAKAIWNEEVSNKEPKQRDFPLKIKL